MEGFWKPGTALPGSIDDKDEGKGNVVVWNPNASLSIDKQRLSLPVYQKKAEILYAIESSRVTIIVGPTG